MSCQCWLAAHVAIVEMLDPSNQSLHPIHTRGPWQQALQTCLLRASRASELIRGFGMITCDTLASEIQEQSQTMTGQVQAHCT